MGVSLDARVTTLEENIGGSAGNGNLVLGKTFVFKVNTAVKLKQSKTRLTQITNFFFQKLLHLLQL